MKEKIEQWASKQVSLFNADMTYPDSLLNPPQEIMDNRKQNSREARERSLPKADSDKGKILNVLKNLDHAKYMLVIDQNAEAMNAVEIAFMCEIDYHAVQRRMSELVRADLVEVARKKDGYTLYKIKEDAK